MDVAELRRIFLFEDLTDEQLAELASVGEEVAFSPGEVLVREGEPAVAWWVLLEGRIDLFRRSGREDSFVGVMERPGVWAGGFRAWHDETNYFSTLRGQTSGRMLRVPAAELRSHAERWFPLGLHLLVGFFHSVRSVEATNRDRARLVALGTLAAGLAHELNNPAAAASRAAAALADTSDDLEASLVRLAEASLSAEQLVAIGGLRRELTAPLPGADAVALSDREDALLEWMERHGVEEAWRIASPLAAAGADVGWSERMAEVLDAATLGPALGWVAARVSTEVLLGEVTEATARVSNLVGEVRSYTQLDRASLQDVDITEGLESTLTVLGHELAGITVERDYDPGLPSIEARPGELNQVWTNLIDNAVDAMAGSGTIKLVTRARDDRVVVEVIDSGPGLPPEVAARAFEPFFTTKPVGEGTGLGLDICRRIVEGHGGTIEIESEPGNTVVRVSLPVGS